MNDLDKLADAETRCDSIANDEVAVRDYLIQKTGSYQFRRDRGVIVATVNGVPLPLEKLSSVSKDGFAWGEPSDSDRTKNLAYSILKHALKHTKNDEYIVRMVFNYFAVDILSNLTIDQWNISVQQIEEYVGYRCDLQNSGSHSWTPVTTEGVNSPATSVMKMTKPPFLGRVNEFLALSPEKKTSD